MLVWVLAVVIGVIGGFAIPYTWFAFDRSIQFLSTHIERQPLLISFAAPFVAATVVFFMLGQASRSRSADAFTYLISDLHFSDGRRGFWQSIFHGIAAFILLLAGGVLGLEALCMEFLTAIGGAVAAALKLPAKQIRTVTACGLVAPIAVIFGQGAAALLFVIEIFYGWAGVSSVVGPVAVCAFVAASVAQTFPEFGFFLLFRGTHQLSLSTAILLIPTVAVVASALAYSLLWLSKKSDKEFHELFSTRRAVDFSLTDFGARLVLWVLATAAAFYFYPSMLGSGLNLIDPAFAGQYVWQIWLVALLIRMFLSVITYTAVGSLGWISPVLVMGALIGQAFSSGLSELPLSFWNVQPTTLALLSLGAFFSASFHTPVAATALTYGLAGHLGSGSLLFLTTSLAANFASYLLASNLAGGESLATMGLYRRGIRFKVGMCFNTLSNIKVKDAMISWINAIPEALSIGDAYKVLMDSRFLKLPVVDPESKVIGMVSLSDFFLLDSWQRLGAESQVHSLVGIKELMKPASSFVDSDMNLEGAVEIMGEEDLVPVIEGGVYKGILLKSDIERLYNKEVVKKAYRR